MISLNINTLKIGIFFYFIAYGYFGAAVAKNNELDFASILITFILSLIFVAYSKTPSHIIEEYSVKINITKINIFIFIVVLSLVSSLFYENLNYFLYSDELSYAKSAHRHGLEVSLILSKLGYFADIKAKYLIQLIGLISLIHFYIVWKLIDRNRYLVAIAILFVIYRLVFDFMGGNANPHPPLELISILASGSFLGISNIGLKLSYFLTYCLFHLLIYLRIKPDLGSVKTFIVVAVISTIPIIFQFSFIIEHAIWGYFFTSILLLEVMNPGRIKLNRVVPLIAIGVLFRQSIFVLLLPIIILFIWESRAVSLRQRKNYFPFFILIIAVPIFLNSLINGTPVTSSINDINITKNIDIIFSYGYMLDSFKNSFGYILLPLFLFAFIPENKGNIRKSISVFILFLVFYFTYHLIDQNAWTIEKYKVEYFAPFILLGLVKFAKILPKYLLLGFLILLLVLNFNSNRFESLLKPSHDCSNVVHYDYEQAYDYISQVGARGVTYSIGATYGVLPEVIAGYSVSELELAKKLYTSVMQTKIIHPVSTAEILSIFKKTRVEYIIVPRNLVTDSELFYKNSSFDIVFGDLNSSSCGELLILKKNNFSELNGR